MTIRPVNEHDSVLLPETVTQFAAFTRRLGLDLSGSFLTLDSGFDSYENKIVIKDTGIKPVIYPNIRNTKQPIKIAQKFRWFNRAVYKNRFVIERTFAWQDVYRRLAISYDRLKETRSGFRYLAYSMINLRVLFNDS